MQVKNTKELQAKIQELEKKVEQYHEFEEDVVKRLSGTKFVGFFEPLDFDDVVMQFQRSAARFKGWSFTFEKAKLHFIIYQTLCKLTNIDKYSEDFIVSIADNGFSFSNDDFIEDATFKIYQDLLDKDISIGNLKIQEATRLENGTAISLFPLITSPFVYVPRIAYNLDEFSYPAVTLTKENRTLSLDPYVMFTHADYISRATGKVLILGLNLGYVVNSVASKDNVSKVTVVESDHNLIELYKTYVLPKIKAKDRIEVIEADVVEYLQTLNDEKYDYILNDLKSRNLDLKDYLKIKEISHKFKHSAIEHYAEIEYAFDLSFHLLKLVENSIEKLPKAMLKKSKEIDDQKLYEMLKLKFDKTKINESFDIDLLLNVQNIIMQLTI